MLSAYLVQKVEHKPRIATNKRSEPTYGTPSSISCRRKFKLQEVILPDKQKVQADYIYYLDTLVHAGDTLDGRNVLSVEPWHALNGEVIGYKAVV